MKALSTLLCLFVYALCASAQAASSPSDKHPVTIVQKKWRVEIRNPALDEDQFKAKNEREQQERKRQEKIKQNEILTERGMPPVDLPVPPLSRDPRPRGFSITYIYEVKIRNIGAKAIRALTWEYLFFEPATERELGRRRFVSKVRIGPGKTRKLMMRSTSSPTGTIDATKA